MISTGSDCPSWPMGIIRWSSGDGAGAHVTRSCLDVGTSKKNMCDALMLFSLDP